MKKYHLIASFLCVLIILSCKKSGSSNNTSNSDVWLSSVATYAPQTSAVDSFSYDSAHRVLQFAQYIWDTSGGSPAAGSEIATFALPAGAAAPPSSYTLSYNGVTDPHVLTYDGQGRISRDTSLSGLALLSISPIPMAILRQPRFLTEHPKTTRSIPCL